MQGLGAWGIEMGWSNLAMAVAAFGFCALAFPVRGDAATVGAIGIQGASATKLAVSIVHRRRAQSFYCYPKTYWWFYRPYTTATNGHARCMPYFHYPVQPQAYQGRGRAYEAPVR